MKAQRIVGGWLLASALAAGWMFSVPAQAAGSDTTITVKGKAEHGPKKPGPGVMDVDGRVLPPERPTAGQVGIHPGMPQEDLREADHERGPNFNAGQFRKADGSVHRD